MKDVRRELEEVLGVGTKKMMKAESWEKAIEVTAPPITDQIGQRGSGDRFRPRGGGVWPSLRTSHQITRDPHGARSLVSPLIDRWISPPADRSDEFGDRTQLIRNHPFL